MADIIKQIEELESLPSDIHWYCPRRKGDQDSSSYFDEDVLEILSTESAEEKAERHTHIEKTRQRRKLIFGASQMLAFDGSDAVQYQDKLRQGLRRQLTRCSICVREFHRSRVDLRHSLEEEFEADQVDEFMKRYDQMNIDRITQGLDSARDTMIDTPPGERKITALSSQEMFALFETMHCMPMLRSEPLLRDHFDQPFRLVQTKSKISMPEYTPALTAFLFSYNDERRQWALRGWRKFKRGISGTEFDWTVKDNLRYAAARVGITALEKEFMPLFWSGLRTIVDKLDQDLITHHLRAMDVDIFRLALDHCQVDTEAYIDLLGTLQLLLEKAPKDVWDAFGAISPQTVLEQIFNSPNMVNALRQTHDNNACVLESVLTWMGPFVSSIKPGNLPAVCRSVLHRFWTKYQDNQFPPAARSVCHQKGLESLRDILKTLNQQSRQSGGAAISEMLEVVRAHVQVLTADLDLSQNHSHVSGDLGRWNASLEVFHYTIALDCILLAFDRESIVAGKPLSRGENSQSLTTWKDAIKSVKHGQLPLASAIINGSRRLLIVEPLTRKQMTTGNKSTSTWNETYTGMQTCQVELLERLQDYDSTELDQLFGDCEAAQGLFALLFSSSQEVQQGAAAVLKVVTSESSRRDAIRTLTLKHYSPSLQAIAGTMRIIARAAVFTPSIATLKVGTDVLESLCASSEGVLRSKSLTDDESRDTEHIWQSLWVAISVIFESTERWSTMGHDKSMMVEFCRDCMDFADQALDKYSVLAGALHAGAEKGNAQVDLERRLLETPTEAASHIVKWLRLRDDYLITKAVTMTCGLMRRLEEVQLQLPLAALSFIEDITSGNVKNKLNVTQKAQLRRALESHLGQSLPGSPEPDEQKPKKQGSLASWVSNGSSAPLAITDKKKQGIDMNAWQAAAAQRREFMDTDSDELKKMKGIATAASPTMEKLKASGAFASNKSLVPVVQKATPHYQVDASEFRRKRMAEQEAKRKRDLAVIAAAKKGRGIGDAGSGIDGIGIEGKDHTVKGEGVMVSSDESSDDDGGLDEELFGAAPPKSKRKSNVKEAAAGAIGLKPEQKQGPVRIQRQVRSQKDMRARLQPDLSPLHKTILGWDFFHDGDYPPNSSEWQFQRVSKVFRHVGDYCSTFQPLLQLEAWQGFARAREEGTSKPYEIKIGSRSSVDAFLEISTAISHAENREIQAHEGDVILFSTANKPTDSPEVPHCLSRVYKINRKKQSLEVVYRVLPGTSLNSSLTPGSVIYGTKIQSITPLEREYSALSGLQYYDLCDEIIKAKPSPLLNYTDKQLEPLISNYTVNKAQAKAIKSALDNDAFTLIQGPPGSGKTKTIVGIVGGILSDSLSSQNAGTKINVPVGRGTFQPATTSKKLLVCAPSNAAVDELVMRLKEGVKTLKGVNKNINVVRLGRSDAINTAVLDVTMDELVKKRLGDVNGDSNAREKTQALMKEHQAVSGQLRIAREKLDSGEVKGLEQSKLQDEFNLLRRRKNELGGRIDNAKDAENAAGRTLDLERRKVQQAVLDESNVICATLSGSGHEMFQSLNIEFETVIVDEAAQCVEVNALIPLKYGCAKCILVGDPKQLPPTVFSKEAARFQYEQSLFVRMQGNHPDSVHLLDTQYRMHPDISAFPSASFYDGRLLDGGDMAGLRKRVWHKSSLLAPYRFFDVQGQHQAAPKGHSLINIAEIEVAMRLYDRLTSDFREYDFAGKIGIITPYKSQLRELKERFSQKYGSTITESVEFNTTDAFQGRESEVIIFSCVRASPAGGVGFLKDIRRMNVGLTRAKCSLWVLGNSQSLVRGEYWNKLVKNAQERDLYTTGNVLAMLNQPSSNFPAKAQPSVPRRALQAASNEPGSKAAIPALNSSPAFKDSSNGTVPSRPSSRDGDRKPTKRTADLPMFQTNKAKAIDKPRNADVKIKSEDESAVKTISVSESSKAKPSLSMIGHSSDVDMKDGYSSSRTATPQPTGVKKEQSLKRPRSETPTSASGDDHKPVSGAAQRPVPHPSVPAPGPRKRRPVDPFMPKAKQPKR